MRICPDHWQLCRDAIETAGLSSLVAVDGEEAFRRITDEMQGGSKEKNFDPLMEMNWHWTGLGLELGGLGMMGETPDGRDT